MNRFFLGRALVVASLAALALGPARSASACGGFFCSWTPQGTTTVNQAAERIIFAEREDGGVTAVIEVLYEGPAERFAWLIPVAGTPEVGISSEVVFERLRAVTNPRFTLNQTAEGACFGGGSSTLSLACGDDGFVDDFGGLDRGPSTVVDDEMDPIEVLDAGRVGPYDYVVLSVDEAVEDRAEMTSQWLRANEYDVTPLGVDRLAPYLDAGLNLLAFRLTKGTSTGSIRPIVVDFGAGVPSIPLRPTAVAANDDMGVMIWVLGQSRAVPANYASLELNPAALDWFDPLASYEGLVTRAANEAGGQGFVTEMAGSTDIAAEFLVRPSERESLDPIRRRHEDQGFVFALAALVERYRALDGLGDAFAPHVVLSDGVTMADVLACPSCAGVAPVEGFDIEALLTSVQELVLEPAFRTAALFLEAPYVTRFYTTMSADEMTLDPAFAFNPDLGDVPVEWVATQVAECREGVGPDATPWRLELMDGNQVRGVGVPSPWPLAADELPANRFVTRMAEAGPGAMVVDNEAEIDAALAVANGRMPPPVPLAADSSSGCSLSRRQVDPAMGFLPLALVVFGLWLRPRRRRRG